MLRFQIPDVVWGILFGIFVTIVVVGSTFQYLPSPLEMFGDDATDCRQPAIYSNEKAKSGKEGPKDNTALLQDTQPGDHGKEPEGKKHEYECLIAKYTGSLAAFTRWLVIATLLLALFGFWQVMVSRKTAKRQLRAYIAIEAARRRGGHTLIPQFDIKFKNCGQTPAYNGTYWIDIKVCEFPLASKLTPSGKKTIGIFELPPASIFVAGQMNDDNIASLSGEQVNGFDGGEIAFYIFGQCDFSDAFDEPRRLKFRLRYGTECAAHGALAIEEINSD